MTSVRRTTNKWVIYSPTFDMFIVNVTGTGVTWNETPNTAFHHNIVNAFKHEFTINRGNYSPELDVDDLLVVPFIISKFRPITSGVKIGEITAIVGGSNTMTSTSPEADFDLDYRNAYRMENF